MKRLVWILALGVAAAALLAAKRSSQSDGYVPPNGFVPHSATAVKIAVAIWVPIYGASSIERQQPFRAALRGDVWTVSGSLPSGRIGGPALSYYSGRRGRRPANIRTATAQLDVRRMTTSRGSRRISNWLTVALLAAAACGEHSRPTDDMATAPTAASFVASFYEWFAKPKSAGGGDFNVDAIEERATSFDPPLLAALREDRAAAIRSPGELVGLDFIPFTANQDPCEAYVVGDATKSADRLRLPVFSVCNGRRLDAPSVTAEVARRNGAWVFTNFIFDDGSDLLALLRRYAEERAAPKADSRPTDSRRLVTDNRPANIRTATVRPDHATNIS